MIQRRLEEVLERSRTVSHNATTCIRKYSWLPELETQATTLIKVVESLGEYINDESNTIRSKAIRFLVEVFDGLPKTFLSRQQIQVLCQFLCDRIEDDGAVHGLTVLSRLSRFTSEMAIMTFRA